MYLIDIEWPTQILELNWYIDVEIISTIHGSALNCCIETRIFKKK